MSRILENLPSFRESGLVDLRELESELRREPLPEIEAANNVEDAVKLLEFHMGFPEPEIQVVSRNSPLGTLTILKNKLEHIVEKD